MNQRKVFSTAERLALRGTVEARGQHAVGAVSLNDAVRWVGGMDDGRFRPYLIMFRAIGRSCRHGV